MSDRRGQALGLSGVVLALACGACGGGGDAKAPGPAGGKKPPAPVTVALAELRDVTATLDAVGHVKASAVVAVGSRVAGQLATVHFKEGDDVQAGQPLFSIDPRPFELAVAQAKARLEHDRILARNADVEAARQTALAKQNLSARQDFDRAQAAAAGARAALQEDQAAIAVSELQLSFAEIAAPISGRTGPLGVNAGNLLRGNDATALVEIRQIQPIFVTFVVPERELPKLRALLDSGKPAVVTAAPDGAGATISTGTLSLVDNAVDEATGTIRAQATFANTDKNLWPGQFVRVKVELAHENGRVTVPARALQEGQDGSFVYVVGADKIAKPQKVTVGRVADETATITEGLAAGQTVVTDGQLRLFPGAEVVVVKPNGEPVGGPPSGTPAPTPGAPK